MSARRGRRGWQARDHAGRKCDKDIGAAVLTNGIVVLGTTPFLPSPHIARPRKPVSHIQFRQVKEIRVLVLDWNLESMTECWNKCSRLSRWRRNHEISLLSMIVINRGYEGGVRDSAYRMRQRGRERKRMRQLQGSQVQRARNPGCAIRRGEMIRCFLCLWTTYFKLR